MSTYTFFINRTCFQIMAAAIAGGALGLLSFFGLLPLTGLALFLACAALVVLFKNAYHRLVFSGVLLFFCVFIEPSPSDLIFCAVIALGLFTGRFRRQVIGRASVVIGMFLVYFLACMPGIFSSYDLNSAIRYCFITFYLFVMSVFVCMYTDRSNVVSLLRAYILAACASFAAGLAGILGLFPHLLMADSFRVHGLFKDANVFGPFFIPAVILLWDDRNKKVLWKAGGALHVLVAALLSLGVLCSYSRAAWINLIAACFIYAFLHLKAIRPQRLLRIVLVVGTAACVLAFLLFSPALRSVGVVRFLLDRAQLQDYDKNRFASQFGGLELILRYPLGVGPGQFENQISDITGRRLSAHSLYIRTASENGVFGGIAFFSALSATVLMLWFKQRSLQRCKASPLFIRENPKKISESPGTVLSPAALIAVLTGLLINSLVIDTLHWRHLWFFIGLALCRIKEKGAGDEYG
ncbi:hypothetical protein SDC9_47364 [bioreactor metagenome]|uniref:O-antigen ligase-related domain-containing protein n=1 Tax=bioreactor metagenome TaxID=1076179 RepID=A0A644WBC0_9ZZZZ